MRLLSFLRRKPKATEPVFTLGLSIDDPVEEARSISHYGQQALYHQSPKLGDRMPMPSGLISDEHRRQQIEGGS